MAASTSARNIAASLTDDTEGQIHGRVRKPGAATSQPWATNRRSRGALPGRFERLLWCHSANQNKLDFRVSSRGWSYILENEAGLSKGDFDLAQRIINDCRKSGMLPLNICAEDGAREFDGLEHLDTWTPAQEAEWILDNATSAYQRYTPVSFWEEQPYYLQLLVEKIDLKSLFAGICTAFYIPRANARGWADINSRAAMMARFKEWEAKGKRPVLLYCGDFDPVGLQISDLIRNNLAELTDAVGWAPDNLIIDRFGLNLDFIEQHNLTWIDGLTTGSGKDLSDPHHPDHNSPHVQRYLRDYGVRKVEANAMVVRPEPSRALLRDTILEYLSAEAPTHYRESLKPVRLQVKAEVMRLLQEVELDDDESDDESGDAPDEDC